MKSSTSPEARAQLSAKIKTLWENPEYRARAMAGRSAVGWKGRTPSDEERMRVSAMKRGVPLSEDHIAAIKAGKARRKAKQEGKR
jgi:hypothetical protein